MKHKSVILLAGLLLFLFSSTGFAAYEIDSVIDHEISGGEMGGLKVTAFFEDGTDETAYWVEDPGPSGYASVDSKFYLYQSQDTYSSPWSLSNTSDSTLTYLLLEGWNASIVFDLIDGIEHTPGSSFGRIDDIAWRNTQDRVTLVGNPNTYYDLYATIEVGLNVAANSSRNFYLDTDKVQAVPIPGAFLLLGSGLICLVGIKRKTL